MTTDADNGNDAALSRRQFLALSAAASVGLITGCATNPVTGRSQLMFISESDEIGMDKKWAPHQFSSDYGAVRDSELNNYVSSLGAGIAALTHRPQMPYNFRVLNAVVVNGYTFPAGSVALNRGLIVACRNEAEVVAILGHELGHVNARHTAQRMTTGIVTGLVVAGLVAYVEHEKKKYAPLAAGLGMVGSNLLLCRYSRSDERQADSLGMDYAVKADHCPNGMAGVMETFIRLRKEKPNVVDLLFATHPMSEERLANARKRCDSLYSQFQNRSMNEERFMDMTRRVRAQKKAIEEMQAGEEEMSDSKPEKAEVHFKEALKTAPDDYAGLLMMAKCCMARGRNSEALSYAESARGAYPGEPQALHVCGVVRIKASKFDAALADFEAYGKLLPGNTNTTYFKGLCHDKAGRKSDAARQYQSYLKEDPDGEFAEESRKRLKEWGYAAPATS